MNNLHRELAPISEAAWAQIEEEVTRTFKRHLAGRRQVFGNCRNAIHCQGGRMDREVLQKSCGASPTQKRAERQIQLLSFGDKT
jgi:uncharacterized linocin/CFP29 family protein